MVNSERKIEVYNEWGRLREVVVGIEDDTIEPEYVPAMIWLDEEGKEYCRKFGGRRTASFRPDIVEEIRKELEMFAETLEICGVTVHRTRPMVNPVEKEYLNCVQRGNMLFGGADFFRVIGNKVLLLNSFRLAFRRKQVFMVRPLLKQLLEGTGTGYICTPPPSPQYNLLDTFLEEDLFLENGDIMCEGRNVYVGVSGNASSVAGIDWLRSFLGPDYTVHLIALKKEHFHLDWVLSLNRPGLLTYCREALVSDLPGPLKNWDKVEVRPEERAGANNLSIDHNTIVVAEQHGRIAEEYRSRYKMNVITVPLDWTIQYGSGPRCLAAVLRRDP